jgi:tripartite ATP-independent transporter DctP family solute receptor
MGGLRALVAGLAGFSCMLQAVPATAMPRIVTIVVNSTAESPQALGAAAFRKALSASLGDRIQIDIRNGDAIGSENALLAGVRGGAADFALLTGPTVSPVVPEYGVYDVPFLFRSAAHLKAVTTGTVGETIAAKFTGKGLVLLGVGEQGFRYVTNSRGPIRTPADMKGLKIRILPNEVYKTAFTSLGAEPVAMEFPLVYAALKEKRIDAQENPASTIDGSRLNEVQTYLSKTGHTFSTIAIVVNRDTFESFDADGRKALMQAAATAADATRVVSAKAAEASMARVIQAGMQVNEIDQQAFVDALKPAEPEFEKRFGRATLDAIRATR